MQCQTLYDAIKVRLRRKFIFLMSILEKKKNIKSPKLSLVLKDKFDKSLAKIERKRCESREERKKQRDRQNKMERKTERMYMNPTNQTSQKRYYYRSYRK